MRKERTTNLRALGERYINHHAYAFGATSTERDWYVFRGYESPYVT